MTTDEVFETWRLRGIGCEANLPCFVTGRNPYSDDDLKPNLSGFVISQEAGKKIVEMFDGLARLDFRPHTADWIQVKVGVLEGHRSALDHLEKLVSDAGNRVSRSMIQKALTDRLLQVPSDVAARIATRMRLGSLRM